MAAYALTLDMTKVIMGEACATRDTRLCCAVAAAMLRVTLAVFPEGPLEHREEKVIVESRKGRRAAARLRHSQEKANDAKVKETILNIAEAKEPLRENPEGHGDCTVKVMAKAYEDKIQPKSDDKIFLNTVEESAGAPGGVHILETGRLSPRNS